MMYVARKCCKWLTGADFHRLLDLCSSILMAQSIYYYLVSVHSYSKPPILQSTAQIPHFGSLLPLDSVTP